MRLKKFAAAGLAAVLALSMAGCAPAVESCPAAEKETTPETSALAAPVYPEMAQYPDESAYWKKDGSFDDDGFSKVYDAWWADKRARNNLQLPDPDGMQRFLRASTGTMLAQGGGQNLVYSPLNVYMALSMLCECTDGNSRAQILTLLGQSDLASVRAQASALWNANYCADGAVTSVLASSLWLRDGTNYVQSTLDTLAKTYYASTFSGEMGSDDYDKVLQSWLNEQTGGLLQEQASGVSFDPDTVLAQATTIYYRAKWSEEFSKSQTSEGTFHAAAGDLTCDFMHRSGSDTYYWGEQFGAIELPLRESGCIELLTGLLAPACKWIGIPPEVVPLMLIRPMSGSAALAVGADLMRTYGPDSLVGRTAAVMLGSTETTFYAVSVYFGAAGVRKTRYTLPAALIADLTGFLAAAVSTRLFF